MDFLIKTYKKVFFNCGKSHIFSSDHLTESLKDLNAINVNIIQHSKQSKNKEKQVNFQKTCKKITTSCKICIKYKKHNCAKTHKIADCYYLNKDTVLISTFHFSNTIQTKEDAFTKKDENANGKEKQTAFKVNKQNTLKQLRAWQAELKKKLTEMENDSDSDFDIIVNFAQITEWKKTDKEKMLLQAPEPLTFNMDNET